MRKPVFIYPHLKYTMKEIGQVDKFVEHAIKLSIEYLPQLGLAIFVLFSGLWVVDKISKLFEKGLVKRELEVSLRTFLISLVGILLKVLLLVTVAGMIGIQTTSFVAILGAAGLAVGLALQGSLSNFAGGVLILIFKPYKVGDTIDAMGQSGKVKEILIFNTILTTGENKNVILPNGAIANGTIVNHSKEAHLLVNIQIALPITTNFEAVKNIALSIMQANPKVLSTPAPAVSLSKINVDHLLISVKPCTIASDASSASNEILEAIQQQLQATGLAFN